MAAFLAVLKFLPEFLSLSKTLAKLIAEGFSELEIKQGLKKIEDAFQEKVPEIRAKKLNDIFRN